MTDINQFDFNKYDVGGTNSTAGDGRLTGSEVDNAKTDGWTIWDGCKEGDKITQYKSSEKSVIELFTNMIASNSYKEYAKLKGKILEKKLSAQGIYPSTAFGGIAYNIDDINSPVYKKAEKEAEIEAKRQLGLSEKAFDIIGTFTPTHDDNDVPVDELTPVQDGIDEPETEISGIVIKGNMDKLSKKIHFIAEVDKIFIQILKLKYNIEITAKDLQYKDLCYKYKTDFEEAKKKAEENLGYKEEYKLEKNIGTHQKNQHTYSSELQADGYIDTVSQGLTGDCWLISGLNSLSETQWGRDAIKQAIDIRPNGDIIITFKGARGSQKQFTITSQELKDAKNNPKYSNGDMDVLAIELAAEKYRKQFGQKLDTGTEEEIYRLITGSNNTIIAYDKQEIRNIVALAKANPDDYAISANFWLAKEGGHAYNVSRFETDENGNKYVILTNPWSSRTEIKITEEEFFSKIVSVQALKNPVGSYKKQSVNTDGKVGNTTGSRKLSDFNVAPAIHAVANSRPNIIRESIKKDVKGNVKVTLKGVGKTYTITTKELAKARDSGMYTQGDDDVIALEIAIEKYGKEKYDRVVKLDDDSLKSGNIPKCGTALYSISDTDAIFLLTGEQNMYAITDEDGNYIISSSRQNGYSKLDLSEIIKKNK